jgi:hypothetical protein
VTEIGLFCFCCSTTTPPVCPPLNLDALDTQEYPAVFYHDIRMDLAVGKDRKFNFFVGVDNVLAHQSAAGYNGNRCGQCYL